MALTQADMEKYLTEWAMEYCNNKFYYGIPAGVKMFVDKAAAYLFNQSGMTSESLGDYSVSMNPDFPPALLSLLAPYRRLKAL